MATSAFQCEGAATSPDSSWTRWEALGNVRAGNRSGIACDWWANAERDFDIARDLGMADEKVRVICQYMGGNFGNKNQNQDADLITAMLAKEAGAPVKLELSRRDDFLGVHGRY